MLQRRGLVRSLLGRCQNPRNRGDWSVGIFFVGMEGGSKKKDVLSNSKESEYVKLLTHTHRLETSRNRFHPFTLAGDLKNRPKTKPETQNSPTPAVHRLLFGALEMAPKTSTSLADYLGSPPTSTSLPPRSVAFADVKEVPLTCHRRAQPFPALYRGGTRGYEPRQEGFEGPCTAKRPQKMILS